jgi:ParB family transcriptional regulator, chromosome partitioning protein
VLLQIAEPDRIPYIARAAIDQKMSVAQLILLVDRINAPPQVSGEPAPAPKLDPNVRAAQTELERALGVRVRISDRKGKGRIVIEYANLEDFDRVLEMLTDKS